MTPARAAIFGCAGTELSPVEREFFAEVRPWGFILFARNIRDAAQICTLTRDLRAAVGYDAPILIDQEGGRVARLRAPLASEWPTPRDHAAVPNAAVAIHDRFATIGAELRALGIDVNCVPCADVARPETHPFLFNRCFGETPEVVTTLARAAADGCLAGGVLPVIKHMPGHGAAHADSHMAAPVVDAPLDTLLSIDFAPFMALSDLPMGMSAHVIYTAIDPDHVGTLSPRVIAAIRERIGFDGLLLTDDICMGALGGTLAARSAAALNAGCDVILHCNGDLAEMREVAAVAGPLEGHALARAEAALAARAKAMKQVETTDG